MDKMDKKDKKDKLRQIALLFFANQGIRRPETWIHWRDELKDGSNKILFFALVEESIPLAKPWIRINIQGKTAWCDPSLVQVEIQGLAFILKYDKQKQIACTYLLSGADIPIRSAEYLYNLPDRTRLCQYPTQFRGELVPLHSASQWKSLIRKHMEAIVETSWSTLSKFDGALHKRVNVKQEKDMDELFIQFAKELQRYSKDKALRNRYAFFQTLVERDLQRLQAKKTETSSDYNQSCPDEFYIPSFIVNTMSPADYDNTCISDYYKPKPMIIYVPVRSPVEWGSWEQEYADDSEGTHSISLQKAIEKACRGQNTVFFRKVTSDIPLHEPWKICAPH
jgi:hypothetical protein